jgi:hypothetical protein
MNQTAVTMNQLTVLCEPTIDHAERMTGPAGDIWRVGIAFQFPGIDTSHGASITRDRAFPRQVVSTMYRQRQGGNPLA